MNFRLISTTGKMLAICAAVSMSSCKKDNNTNSADNAGATALSDSSTAAENAYYDVLNTAFVGISDNASVWSSSGIRSGKTAELGTHVLGEGSLGCALYSFDDETPGQYPKTLTLDFGEGCTSLDGITRSGKISYLFSNLLVYPSATATVTFDHYKVNGYGIQGQYVITNTFSESNGHSFNTQVTNGIVTYPDASNYHYSHNKNYKLSEGDDTPDNFSDDVYAVSGTASFSSSAGNTLVFTAAASSPLERAISCSNISKGVLAFVYNQGVSGTIDFGNGTCDKIATLTIGNQQATIQLR